ncbi:MAG: L-histidine N(alpha)-methyltransferase [Rhodospirillales bacterium]|nr:L-histidine N(alpha)-methyltransferase [Rhodospirillales bacterium]
MLDQSLNQKVTKVALGIFSRKEHGTAGSIAYADLGASLFTQYVLNTPDYYPYWGEIEHICAQRESIARDINCTERAIIVGPGPRESLRNKELQILELLPKLRRIETLELSAEFNHQSAAELREFAEYYRQHTGRKLDVICHQMDFTRPGTVIKPMANTTVFSTGSLFSNIPNASPHGSPDSDLKKLLQAFGHLAGKGGKIVLGYDSNTVHDSLSAAYNQKALGNFILNIPKIIADHCIGIEGFDPNPDNFRYEMEWIPKASQVAFKLIAENPQDFSIQRERFHLRMGDEYIFINSVKPRVNIVNELARDIGILHKNAYLDEHGLCEHVLKVEREQDPLYKDNGQPSITKAIMSLLTGNGFTTIEPSNQNGQFRQSYRPMVPRYSIVVS